MDLFTNDNNAQDREDLCSRSEGLDIRMVMALAGDRTLNAREQSMLERLQQERGEGLFSDLVYALTNRAFPARQAKQLWGDITNHRKRMKTQLGRDVGISVAAHDYLVNGISLLNAVSIIEESKLSSYANIATRDGLTGLYDNTTFKHRLKEELERMVRYGRDLALVMFDIDHFKNINDTYGHAEGDAVIKHIADILRGQVRRMDTPARYGGEEFAVILPEVNLEAATIFAERLRQKVEAECFAGNDPVTISLGIAAANPHHEPHVEEFIKQADGALYEAKRGGRNRVCKG